MSMLKRSIKQIKERRKLRKEERIKERIKEITDCIDKGFQKYNVISIWRENFKGVYGHEIGQKIANELERRGYIVYEYDDINPVRIVKAEK